MFEVIIPVISANHSRKNDRMIKKIINAFFFDAGIYKFKKIMALHEGIIPYNNNSGSPLRFVPISNMSEGLQLS